MNKKISENIKKRIIELADQNQLSINKVCEMSNITTSTVNTFLNNGCEYCNMKTIIKLCEGFGITVS